MLVPMDVPPLDPGWVLRGRKPTQKRIATLDDDASDPDLSDEHLALYWYFWDSRGRFGVPKKTRTMAMNDFRMKYAKLTSLMQEIEDAGYWHIGDNGTPQFSPDQPSRPAPIWAEPEDPSALTHAGGRAYARSQKPKALVKSYNNTPVIPLRGIPHAAEAPGPETRLVATHMTEEQARRMSRRFGREVFSLVDNFAYRVRKNHGGFAPGQINGDALGANLKKWMAFDGITYDCIMTMMEIFVTEPQFMRKGMPAWKSFLAQRQRLLTLAEDRRKRTALSNDWKRGKT